jgi:SAM-dependent methyltransferase
LDAEDYEAWYHTARGRWIGDTEFDLLNRLLRGEKGETLLDVGCGTGYFTRRFPESGLRVVGLDPDLAWLRFAKACDGAAPGYCAGTAERLPFPDRSFDRTVSIAALCFIEEQKLAVREILRVTRMRFAIGLLNRHSLLYLRKGRHGGSGAYRGAHWHTAGEIRKFISGAARRAAGDQQRSPVGWRRLGCPRRRSAPARLASGRGVHRGCRRRGARAE